ncbi:SURF1 family protein [Aurantimonas sp. 22II-16-19i]|uniref:SURF1 family protein n=1 Tax=Aurantimonas sp. 22II-16-19i TaxID=1317114 RepID=UPI0009F7DEEA|nr:SURF1 family protein [Aurantimonas sp. 22II-16-19i]ORE97438.1 Surfeit locus 1 [Aurantimonas sp. 22II-16-19i]
MSKGASTRSEGREGGPRDDAGPADAGAGHGRPGGDVPATGEPRMGRGRFALALGFCLVGIAILFALGSWQLERLHWKEALIAEIDSRIHAEPVDLATLEARFAAGEPIDYTPVTVTGRFLNDHERYFLSTFEGQAGWNVYAPLRLAGGDVVFVNRGFVPYDMRDPDRRRAGQPEGEVTLIGLARAAPTEKPGYFTPENEPAKDTFFWQDLPAMAEGVPLGQGARLVPFLVAAGPGRAEGGWPVGGTTVVSLPNNHLQYVVTWYGICLVLVVMTAMMIVRRYRGRA